MNKKDKVLQNIRILQDFFLLIANSIVIHKNKKGIA